MVEATSFPSVRVAACGIFLRHEGEDIRMIPTPEEAAQALSDALNDDTRELRSWKELFTEAFRARDRAILSDVLDTIEGLSTLAPSALAALRKQMSEERTSAQDG